MNYLEKLEQYNHNIVMENKRLAQEYKSIVSEAAGVPLDRKSDKYQGVSKIGNKTENSDDLTPDDNLNIKECNKVRVPDPNLESGLDKSVYTENEDDEVDVDTKEPLDTDISVVDDDVPCEDDECKEIIPIPEDVKQQIIDLGVDTMESDCRFSIHFEDENDENFQKVIEILATAGVSGAVAVTDFGTYIAVAKECPDDTDDVDDDDTVDVDDTVEVDDDTVDVDDDDSIDIVDEEMSPELKSKLINTAAGTAIGAGAGAAGGYLSTKDPEKRRKRAAMGALAGAGVGGYAGYKTAGSQSATPPPNGAPATPTNKPPVEVVDDPDQETPVEVTDTPMEPGSARDKMYADMAREHRRRNGVRESAGKARRSRCRDNEESLQEGIDWAGLGGSVINYAKEHPVTAAAIGGAAIGALSNKEDRLGGAIKGAALGGGAMALGGYLNGKLNGAPAPTPAADAGASATVVDDVFDPVSNSAPVSTPTDTGAQTTQDAIEIVDDEVSEDLERTKKGAKVGAVAGGLLGAVGGAAAGGPAGALVGGLHGATKGAIAGGTVGLVGDAVFGDKEKTESIQIREARARRRIRENTLQTRDEFFDSNRVKPLPESIQNMLRTNKKLFAGNK